MMRIDPAWLPHGWLMLLAFTSAVLVVAPLRRLFRRLFGAERAFQLWLLLPLAMLASQWPHAPSDAPSIVVKFVSTITTAVSVVPSRVDPSDAIDWRSGMVLIWFAGIAITLTIDVRSQLRYRSRMIGASMWDDAPSRWPVLQAVHADIGPAMVGAWRVRIVLPSDFHDRYDATERALILAHEATHADRRDGWWLLLAHGIVAVFWFHPLAWLAITAMREDQELACDAAVMRKYGTHRRSYASAMLKTQSAALALPIGCLWSPRHPITERIAMLKFSAPTRRRRLLGAIAVSLSMAGSIAAVHAMNQTMPAAKADVAVSPHEGPEYQLDVYAQRSAQDIKSTRIERATLAICSVASKPVAIHIGDWNVEATIVPEAVGTVRIDLSVLSNEHKALANSQLHGSLGQAIHADLKGADGKSQYAFILTPLTGCSARDVDKSKVARQKTSSPDGDQV